MKRNKFKYKVEVHNINFWELIYIPIPKVLLSIMMISFCQGGICARSLEGIDSYYVGV